MVDLRLGAKLRCMAAGMVGLAALLTAGAAVAQFRCAELKPSTSRQPPYQRIAGDLRCEGFYDQHVSQPFIELVSLTAAAPNAPAGAALQISASRRIATQLIVQPLRPAPFYRVDAPIAPGQSVRWEPATMLEATGLRLRDLGFLALADEVDGTAVVVPVGFEAPAGDAPAPVQAVLRVSVAVTRLAWRSQRVDGGDAPAAAWREIPGPPRFAWERVPLTLELPADGRGVHIDVQAVDADGKVLPLLHFRVKAPGDGPP